MADANSGITKKDALLALQAAFPGIDRQDRYQLNLSVPYKDKEEAWGHLHAFLTSLGLQEVMQEELTRGANVADVRKMMDKAFYGNVSASELEKRLKSIGEAATGGRVEKGRFFLPQAPSVAPTLEVTTAPDVPTQIQVGLNVDDVEMVQREVATAIAAIDGAAAVPTAAVPPARDIVEEGPGGRPGPKEPIVKRNPLEPGDGQGTGRT